MALKYLHVEQFAPKVVSAAIFFFLVLFYSYFGVKIRKRRMARLQRDIDAVVADLAGTSVNEKEVSFVGRGLKLDTEADAKDVVEAVNKCPNMTTLCLEGNTVGCDAAKAIAKALESQPKFKRALWKDMFTGRLKTEIPKALNYLSSGVMLAKAQLVELDLSDNAFGPVGVEGITTLISSPACHTLQELRLNNNGLGPNGGKMLARCLQECHQKSQFGPNRFLLRVFVCGRNRLENEGATALSGVFKVLGSLEEVSMPQNGIYHEGISALATALSHNPKLKVINLNDNTFTEKGAQAFSACLGSLQQLEVINFGDCLIRSEGAAFICDALRDEHLALRELHLNNNEIGKDEGIALAEAMENKRNLKKLELNGNCFGAEGRELIEGTLEAIGQRVALGSLSDDEGGDEDDEEDYREDDDDENQENDVLAEEPDKENQQPHVHASPMRKGVTATDFYASPSSLGLELLGNNRAQLLLAALGTTPSLESYIDAFIKISSVIDGQQNEVGCIANECVDRILTEAFSAAEKTNSTSELTNILLVHLGLIKCEDKKFRVVSNLCGPFTVLEHAVRQPYFNSSTLDVLQLFLSRPNNRIPVKLVHPLMTALYQR